METFDLFLAPLMFLLGSMSFKHLGGYSVMLVGGGCNLAVYLAIRSQSTPLIVTAVVVAFAYICCAVYFKIRKERLKNE